MSDEQKDENLKDEMAENITKADDMAEDKTDLKKKSLFGRQCKDCGKFKQEADEYKSRWQRALADYQNLQKETAARRAEWAKLSEQQILEEFIPVYEHLKTAVACHSREGGNPDAWAEGVRHVLKQFADILKSHGVEEIKIVGEKFDPVYHEAVGHEAADGAGEDEIIREVAGGYKMGERVIRAAKVIVAKKL
jgi:molecular chaperone GrpE